ncbi:MAG TPA: hypothetical protein VI855_08785 [Dehalococcoidia bacterium]|nr:hypothetical protein [Dehalococcoidia bacterium]
MRNVSKFLTDQKGVSMIMVVGFLAIALPVVTAALALAGTLSLDSLVKNRLARDQYSHLGVQSYIEHVANDPGWQDWVDEGGCGSTIELNGQQITLNCAPPAGAPGDAPPLVNRQLRSFKEVNRSAVTLEQLAADDEFTYTIRVFNDAGADNETHHGHLGHGYWKQPHHFESWQGFAPGDDFETVFGVGLPQAKTLLEAMQEGGGHQDALNRHAVAALLNASSPNVDFDYSVNDVIGFVQDAYASSDFYSYGRSVREADNEAHFLNDDDDDGDDDDTGRERLRRIYDGLPPGFSYVNGSSCVRYEAGGECVPIGDPAVVAKSDKNYGEEEDDDEHGDGHLGPNYWKQANNYAAWTGYTSDLIFSDVFNGYGPSNKTLMQILNQSQGTDERKMQTEAVAALLNAAHSDIQFQYPEPDNIIALVIQAYAVGGMEFENVQELLEQANEDAYYDYEDPSRTQLIWDLEDLDIHILSGEMLELQFGAQANVAEGNYCNEAWTEPGYKDHDNDDDDGDDDDDEGRGAGTDMTAGVKVGSPVEQLCPGEAVYITTTVDPAITASGDPQEFTYTVELENVGNTTLHIARINDILPPGFSYVLDSAGDILNQDPVISDFNGGSSNHLEWSGAFASAANLELEAGETVTLSFQASGTPTLDNYTNEVWVYFTEFSGQEEASYSWPTAVVRAMDVVVVTATDAEGNVVGTYQVWVGTDETIVQ